MGATELTSRNIRHGSPHSRKFCIKLTTADHIVTRNSVELSAANIRLTVRPVVVVLIKLVSGVVVTVVAVLSLIVSGFYVNQSVVWPLLIVRVLTTIFGYIRSDPFRIYRLKE